MLPTVADLSNSLFSKFPHSSWKYTCKSSQRSRIQSCSWSKLSLYWR